MILQYFQVVETRLLNVNPQTTRRESNSKLSQCKSIGNELLM